MTEKGAFGMARGAGGRASWGDGALPGLLKEAGRPEAARPSVPLRGTV